MKMKLSADIMYVNQIVVHAPVAAMVSISGHFGFK